MTADDNPEFAAIGVTTVYEAAGRVGLLDHEWIQLIPGSRLAGPALTVACGQNDNRAVHEATARANAGDVLVVTMPEPGPVGLVGELLVTQMLVHGIRGLILDAAARDVDELVQLGLPIWTRWVRSTGATRKARGRIGEPLSIGGTNIRRGDLIVADRDGIVCVEEGRKADVLTASRARGEKETRLRTLWQQGTYSYDEYGLRAADEPPPRSADRDHA